MTEEPTNKQTSCGGTTPHFTSRRQFYNWMRDNFLDPNDDLPKMPLPCFNLEDLKEHFFEEDRLAGKTLNADYDVNKSDLMHSYLMNEYLNGSKNAKRFVTEEVLRLWRDDEVLAEKLRILEMSREP